MPDWRVPYVLHWYGEVEEEPEHPQELLCTRLKKKVTGVKHIMQHECENRCKSK